MRKSTTRRILFIAALVIAGEMVFALPFHVPRFFRSTYLDVFGVTNTQMGDIFMVYGITAMACYFPGGALADHFSARKLLTASLLATSVGGLYLASIPGSVQMGVLYGFWGVSTIFLFWGALIRTTREWGGQSSQGVAFGILESGRGLAAAIVASVVAIAFALLMPDDPTTASDATRRESLRVVIYLYTAATLGAALLTWYVIPESDVASSGKRNPFKGMREVVGRPIIWAQAAIIICAYCFYKATDNYQLYAVQVLGYNETDASLLTAASSYVRPVGALVAGIIADRFSATRSIGVAFFLLAIVYAALAILTPDTVGVSILIANMFISLFAIFALRGIYFALLEETRMPRHITGAAVGMISFIGYAPEIFFGSIAGRVLDATPGVGGHLNLFKALAVVAVLGVGLVAWLLWLKRNKLPQVPASSSQALD